jgi:hypothetical protein
MWKPAVALVLFLAPLAGCADPYGDAQKLDTIEAWEAYLSTKPGGTDGMLGQKRLTELYVARAAESKKLEDYDKALKHLTGKAKKEMQVGRANVAFAAAEADGSAAAWEKFLKEDDFADDALKKRARAMVAVAKHRDELSISDAVVAQVNLAENPKGPLDGWSISVDVTNNGTNTFDYLILEAQLLDGDGKKLSAATYPLVSKVGPRGMPIEEKYQEPMKPGEKRSWQWTTGEPPEGWAQKARVVPTAIRAVGELPGKGDKAEDGAGEAATEKDGASHKQGESIAKPDGGEKPK